MPDKLDLDLINLVQRGRMAHDNEMKPSQVSGVYWIEAKHPDNPIPTPRAGSWRMTTTSDDVDDQWAQIKAATEAGQLGYKAKVSTASREANADSRIIHVLTTDSADQVDVDRVRTALDTLDMDGDWTYHAER